MEGKNDATTCIYTYIWSAYIDNGKLKSADPLTNNIIVHRKERSAVKKGSFFFPKHRHHLYGRDDIKLSVKSQTSYAALMMMT